MANVDNSGGPKAEEILERGLKVKEYGRAQALRLKNIF